MGLNPIGNPDWPRETVDLIDHYVGLVRDNATAKARTVVLGVVYGTLAAFAGLAAGLLLLVLVIRLTQIILGTWVSNTTAVWASYFLIGGLFLLIGLLLLRASHRPPRQAQP